VRKYYICKRKKEVFEGSSIYEIREIRFFNPFHAAEVMENLRRLIRILRKKKIYMYIVASQSYVIKTTVNLRLFFFIRSILAIIPIDATERDEI